MASVTQHARGAGYPEQEQHEWRSRSRSQWRDSFSFVRGRSTTMRNCGGCGGRTSRLGRSPLGCRGPERPLLRRRHSSIYRRARHKAFTAFRFLLLNIVEGRGIHHRRRSALLLYNLLRHPPVIAKSVITMLDTQSLDSSRKRVLIHRLESSKIRNVRPSGDCALRKQRGNCDRYNYRNNVI